MSNKPTKRNRKPTVHETGKAGGEATLKKYGKKHYKEIAEKRWGKANKKK